MIRRNRFPRNRLMTSAVSRALASMTAGWLLLSFPAPGRAGDLDGNTVIAEVDGVKLTFADFEKKRPGALFQAQNDFYIAERKAVEAFIEDHLLEQQAKK